MVEKSDSRLSIRKQCELLGVNRNRLEPKRPKTSEEDLELMGWLDELHIIEPTFGTRGLRRLIKRVHQKGVGRNRIRRLMRVMGMSAIYQTPRTSKPHPGHKKYSYLLKNMTISRPNQVWCADITYIPMPRGFCYLVAIMDWYSRKVLSWKISTTMDVSFCIDAFNEAVKVAGRAPEIMNTDQGSQFTCTEWIETLKGHKNLKISMDGKGRWLDNVFIERLWRSLKYEDVYLKSYSTLRELSVGVGEWMERYNTFRPHSSLNDHTPAEVYGQGHMGEQAA